MAEPSATERRYDYVLDVLVPRWYPWVLIALITASLVVHYHVV